MRAYKKIFILFFLAFNFVLHSSFSLSDVNQLTSEPSMTKEVVQLDEEAPPLFMEDSSEPGEYNYWQQFFRMMLILGLILGGVLIIAWFLKGYLNKRVMQVNLQNRIKVLERRNLSQKSMLYLIEVGGKQLVISDSQSGGVQFLMQCPNDAENFTPAEVEKTKDLASRFSFTQILQRKLSEKALKPFFNSKNIKTDYEIHEEN